ncbi:TrbC/VirB2 family protein [Erythrobacter insulae]|nr:TrbC/VirB2 family protein [Erythrobacter insulae]
MTPDGTAPISRAMDWIGGLIFGSFAITLCVLAVAFVGFLMLSGRLALRDALRVILGCFVLLGAPAIASAFI